MRIGSVTLNNNFILAPMAGFTNAAVRRLMAENGAGLTVTEMVSARGLLFGSEKTSALLTVSEAEKVSCVQLFGYEPEDFSDCVRLPELAGFDIIDINMGCPVKKIVKNGEGCALMSEPGRAAAIVRAVKDAGRTVTVKTRLGLTTPGEILDFCTVLEDAGADMVSLHCRTAAQMYAGFADYSVCAAVKKKLSIPLAINGDITDSDSYKKAIDTGADAVMIGRGALLDPGIFLILCGKAREDKKTLVLRLLDYMYDYLGESDAVVNFRKFLPYVLKGTRGGKDLRRLMNFCTDMGELKRGLQALLE